MRHSNIKEKHLVSPNYPTFEVIWNYQAFSCYFDQFVIFIDKDKIEFHSLQCNEYKEYDVHKLWGHYEAKEFTVSPEKVKKVNEYFAENKYPLECFGYDKTIYINGFEALTNPSCEYFFSFPLEKMVDNILEILWDEN